MYLEIYPSLAFTDGTVLKDEIFYGAHSTINLQQITIGGTVYKYAQSVLVWDPLVSAGTTLINAVTTPTAPQQERTYYLKGGKKIVTAARTDETAEDQWAITLYAQLYVGNTIVAGVSVPQFTTENPANHAADYSIKFCSIINDGVQYYGFCASDAPDTNVICCFVSENFFDESIAKPYEGGADGSDPASGFGDNDTESENCTRIGGLGGILAGAGHGLHVYELNQAAYSELLNNMLSKNIDLAISRKIWDLSDSIISVHRLPVLNRSQTATTVIVTGGFDNIVINTGVCKMDSSNIITVDSQPVQIGTIKGDFLDYTETKAVLYLPFCGSVPISIQDIMQGSIRVLYEIDIVQGNCVANVYTTNYQGREKLQGCYSGNCAYRIPLMGSSDGSGQIAGLIQTAVGAVTGNAALAGAGLFSTLGAQITPTVYAAGSTGGNSAYYSDTQCSLIIYRPNAIYPTYYSEILGRPTGCSAAVSAFSGLVSGTLHAEIAGATEEEKRQIESLFESGVYV